MKRLNGVVSALAVLSLAAIPARAADDDPKAIIDKGIQALGGEEKLAKADAFSVKADGKITFGGNENEFSSESTYQGLDHFRGTFKGEFNGNTFEGVTVVNGNKGWRKFGDMVMEIDGDGLDNEKRTIYLRVLPTTLVGLKKPEFKLAAAREETVDGKPAVGVKVTGEDGKPFTIYFDKESGLPVKLEAVVTGFMGDEFTEETTYADYKDFGGIKRATKVKSSRDGEPFVEQTVTDFKVLDKVDPKTFDEPK
jgi:hypothetical protein